MAVLTSSSNWSNSASLIAPRKFEGAGISTTTTVVHCGRIVIFPKLQTRPLRYDRVFLIASKGQENWVFLGKVRAAIRPSHGSYIGRRCGSFGLFARKLIELRFGRFATVFPSMADVRWLSFDVPKVPILLQKSHKAQRLIFRQRTKQATIADH